MLLHVPRSLRSREKTTRLSKTANATLSLAINAFSYTHSRTPSRCTAPQTGAEIREAFLSFYESKGHTRLPSSRCDSSSAAAAAAAVSFSHGCLTAWQLGKPPGPGALLLQRAACCRVASDATRDTPASHPSYPAPVSLR